MNVREYNAKQIGELFAAKLHSPVRGQVYAVSPLAINFTVDGELYTIGKAKIGNGPGTVLLELITENLDLWGCALGDEVYCDGQKLEVSGVTIHLTDAEVWESGWQERPHPERMFRLLPQLKALAIREGNLKGLGLLLLDEEEDQGEFDLIEYTQRVVLEQANPLITQLRQALFMGADKFWAVAQELVGLGPGLTPAGDDFLLGFLLMFRFLEFGGHFRLPDVDLAVWKVEILGNTNLLSATGVIHAAEGRPFELARDLLENLCTGRKVHTILSALRLIDRGTTSGTDILTGMVVAGEIFQKIYFYQQGFVG